MNLEVIPMFNKSLLALVLAAATGSAFAAPVANLKIDGKVTPPTCTVNGAEQGELLAEFGAVSPSWLLATGTTNSDYKQLTSVIVPLTVSCDAQTYLTFVPTDTFKGPDLGSVLRSALVSASDSSIIIGQHSTLMNNMKVDGKASGFGRETGYNLASNLNVPGLTTAWTTENQYEVAKSAMKLAAGKVFTADLEVRAFLFSREKLAAQKLDLTERIDYIGENVLTFNFGI